MGGRLVSSAMDRVELGDPELDHASFRLLLSMAYHVYDTADPPIYGLGRIAMAIGMGYTADKLNDKAVQARAFVSVKRAVSMLIGCGLIKVFQPAGGGRSAAYLLCFDAKRGRGGGHHRPPPTP